MAFWCCRSDPVPAGDDKTQRGDAAVLDAWAEHSEPLCQARFDAKVASSESQACEAKTPSAGNPFSVESELERFEKMSREELRDELVRMTFLAKTGGIGFPALEDKETLKGLIRKVNHISRVCLSAEISRDFYVGTLGAIQLSRPNFPSPGYWLWLGNLQLHLIQGPQAREELMHAAGVPTGNVNHISFEVHDFDKVEQRLIKLKVPFKKNRVPGSGDVIHQLFLQDPDKHYIEICDCDKLSSWVFGLEEGLPSKIASCREGVNPSGACIAAAAALAFLPGECAAGTEEEFVESLGILWNAFKVFAGDDGYVQAHEWKSVLQRMGHSVNDEEISSMLKQHDLDSDGQIDFKEFVRFMAPRLKPEHSDEELRRAFTQIDRDRSGSVSEDELFLMLWGIGQRVDEEQLAYAIRKADKDGNGTIEFGEFLQLFKSFKTEKRMGTRMLDQHSEFMHSRSG